MNDPSSKTTIFAPVCCGVEPLVLITAAIAPADAPLSKRLYISRKTSADDIGAPNSLRRSNSSDISFRSVLASFHLTHRQSLWASIRLYRHQVLPHPLSGRAHCCATFANSHSTLARQAY